MNFPLRVASLSLLLALRASAGPGMPGMPPANVETSRPAPAAVRAAAKVEVKNELKTELKRLMIGNQAGIVKVLGPNREGVAYIRGLDDQSQARFNDEACLAVFNALGFPHTRVNAVAQDVMSNFAQMPKKEAVAFLGAVACSQVAEASTKERAEKFFVQVMETDKDVYARRQAILALAVKPQVLPETTDHVLALYEHSENLWETFPVQQYFEYHAHQLRRQGNFAELRSRVAAVNSLYTPAILGALDKV